MSITKKILVASLALILVLPASFGCAMQVSAQEIADNAVMNYPKVATVKMDMNVTMTVEVIGGTEAAKITMLENATSSLNIARTEIKMTMNVSGEIPGQGKQNISTEMYLVNGWMYIKVASPSGGEQWTKMNLTEQLWAAQNQLAQQVEFLKTAIEVISLGSEKVDGIDCYVLQVKPNMEALIQWVMAQQQTQSGIDLSELNLAKLFKTTSIKEWIAKDSYLPVKVDMDVVLEMLPEDVGATAKDFEKITMEIKGQVKYYDYDKPVTIELPPAALNAQAMPSGQ